MGFDSYDYRYDIESIIDDERIDIEDAINDAVSNALCDIPSYRFSERIEDLLEKVYDNAQEEMEDSIEEQIQTAEIQAREDLFGMVRLYMKYHGDTHCAEFADCVSLTEIINFANFRKAEHFAVGDEFLYENDRYVVLEDLDEYMVRAISKKHQDFIPKSEVMRTGRNYPQIAELYHALDLREVELANGYNPEVAIENTIANNERF